MASGYPAGIKARLLRLTSAGNRLIRKSTIPKALKFLNEQQKQKINVINSHLYTKGARKYVKSVGNK